MKSYEHDDRLPGLVASGLRALRRTVRAHGMAQWVPIASAMGVAVLAATSTASRGSELAGQREPGHPPAPQTKRPSSLMAIRLMVAATPTSAPMNRANTHSPTSYVIDIPSQIPSLFSPAFCTPRPWPNQFQRVSLHFRLVDICDVRIRPRTLNQRIDESMRRGRHRSVSRAWKRCMLYTAGIDLLEGWPCWRKF